MATRDRKDFVLQSIKYFHNQNYPSRELIILDDGKHDLSEHIKTDSDIRYIRLTKELTIGAKRNYGCELARGEIIAQWDDDDWYAPSRLSAQIEPLNANIAELSAFSDCIFLELAAWRFWRCSTQIFDRMFVGNVHGGTLVFKRLLFERGIRYPAQSLAEDAYFLYQCNRGAARLHRTESKDMFIYLRHSNSTWQFECGKHIDPQEWQRIAEPEIPFEDLQFLKTQSRLFPDVRR